MQFISEILLSILKLYRYAPSLLLIIVLAIISWALWNEIDLIEYKCNKRIEKLELELYKCREEQINLIVSLQTRFKELEKLSDSNTKNKKNK